MKIPIECRFTGNVLFEYEHELNSIKITLEAALKARANLYRANLYRANLYRANLYGANLYRANLSRANLSRAYLDGANLDEKENTIEDITQIGNIGSRGGYTVVFKCKKSIEINCGCFWGSIEKFEKAVSETHKDNIHGKHYMAMIEFIKKI